MRLPRWLVEQLAVVRAGQEHPSLAHTVQTLVELGLEAFLDQRAGRERIEALVARIDDQVLSILTILNMTQSFDPADLDRLRPQLLAAWQAKRAPALARRRR